jgi:hypothetical protein
MSRTTFLPIRHLAAVVALGLDLAPGIRIP